MTAVHPNEQDAYLEWEGTLVEQFEADRRAGKKPRMEAVLSQVAADRKDLVKKMLLMGGLLTDFANSKPNAGGDDAPIIVGK